MPGKISLILVLIMIILPFGSKHKVDTSGGPYSYNIYETPYTLDDGYSFLCVQVCSMKDKELEKKINRNLTKYFSLFTDKWFGDEKTNENGPVISLESPRYLSVKYSFGYIPELNTTWYQCVTIDMQSGEVVFLDDLVKLNKDFAKLVKNKNIIQCKVDGLTISEVTERQKDFFSKGDITTILNYFKNFIKGHLYGSNDKNRTDVKANDLSSVYETYFYLKEGAICFSVLDGSGTINVYIIKTDDIQDYLKVPKW